jgi:hypothetical protein
MHRISSLAVGCLLMFTGCAPYVISYKHVHFKESDRLRVIERSSSSPDSQGKPVHWAKIGLSTKVQVSGNDYLLDIGIPINALPVVFLNVHDLHGKALMLSGPHIIELKETSGAFLDGYRFSFLVQEASEQPERALIVTIKDGSGAILGNEVLPYEIRSRGFVYGIEGL